MEEKLSVINAFKGKRVMVIGDIVADQYLSGTITRISREAPVFIMRHDETETRAGGAANAAVNIASLGGTPVLIGLCGMDAVGETLIAELGRSGVDCETVVRDEHFRTTTKTRVLAGQQYAPRHQVIRIDYENRAEIADATRLELARVLASTANDADAIVISDYNYGVAESSLFEQAREVAREREIPLLIDSRFRLASFAGAVSATPNQEEVEQLLGGPMTDTGCEQIRASLDLRSLLVTCGNRGMRLFVEDREPETIDAVGSTDAVDVTGAGDTVIAAYSLGLAAGASFSVAAHLANHAGGVVVMKKGTAAVTADELRESMRTEPATTATAI